MSITDILWWAFILSVPFIGWIGLNWKPKGR